MQVHQSFGLGLRTGLDGREVRRQTRGMKRRSFLKSLAFTGAAGSRGGYFASARGGTLLLDDFQNLKLSRQKMLLGVLEDGSYRPVGSDRPVSLDCRVVIGLDDDPDTLVEARRLHPHLRYRFGYAVVRLPPLNERREEIPALAQRFLEECAARTGVADGPRVIARDALATLMMGDYPGNVRQLRGMIEAGYLLAKGDAELQTSHLPGSARSGLHYDRRAPRDENLRANEIDVRVFVLLGLPGIARDEAVEWAVRSALYAADRDLNRSIAGRAARPSPPDPPFSPRLPCRTEPGASRSALPRASIFRYTLVSSIVVMRPSSSTTRPSMSTVRTLAPVAA